VYPVGGIKYRLTVRSSEWVAFVFFAWLVAAGWLRRLPRGRRCMLTLGGLAACAAIAALTRVGSRELRDWAPALYVLVGYFLSGRLFVSPSTRLEQRLAHWDRRVLGDPATRFGHWPRWLLAYLDLVYVFCFLMVPGGYLALVVTGHAGRANRYWTMVVMAECVAFASLAIVQARPPWAIERPATPGDRAVHRFATSFVRHATIGANTLPSGHVAASLAAAFAVGEAAPWIGTLLTALAVHIALACVVGRYHYVVDVIAGGALALAVWAGVAVLML
jgi:membrane-associated phospholipid phosphatase